MENTKSSQMDKDQGSFRDPSGHIFFHDGELIRFISHTYQSQFDHLISSGLYDRLVDQDYMVSHVEVDGTTFNESTGYKYIKPTKIPFISYPYEWSFSQLKDAAILTLKIQKLALQHGMTLKDSSAYNVQFINGAPIFIDTLSFDIYQEGKPWDAYRQYCQHFLAPLALMSYIDPLMNQELKNSIDGIDLNLASKLLPFSTRINLNLLSHIHLHAKAQREYSDRQPKQDLRKISKTQLSAFIENLERTTCKLDWKPLGTEWAEYYDNSNYSSLAVNDKHKLVQNYIEKVSPKIVWDLGGNIGKYSRIASDKGIFTVCFDIDPGAVEKNYLLIQEKREKNLLPVVMDFTNPSPAIGWDNRERKSLRERRNADLILALAFLHHLAISNNVPLPDIAKSFAELGKWLIIEYIPKSDSQVIRLLSTREDIFPNYSLEGFKAAFSEFYDILDEDPLADSGRTLFLMKRKEHLGP